MDQELKTEDIQVRIIVNDVPVSIGMSVPAENVKLRRVLHVLRSVSNAFIDTAEENIRDSGKQISCKAGCGACCRQLVPISEAEAFDLRDQIEAMPEPRRSEIVSRFEAGMAILNGANFFSELEAAAFTDAVAYDEAIKAYFRFGISCPFLENGSCSIHQTRPLTCREYLVTSPAELCDSAEGEGVENVEHFFQFKEALIGISRNATSEELPFVPLIRTLEWTRDREDNSQERSGKEWVADLFNFMAKHSKPQ